MASGSVVQIIEEARASASAGPRLFSIGGELVGSVVDGAAAAAEGGVVGEEAVGIGAVAGSVEDLFIIPILITVLLIMLAIAWVFVAFAAVLGNVWLIGRYLRAFSLDIAKTFDAPFAAVTAMLVGQVNGFWQALTTTIGYFSDRHAAQSAVHRIPGNTPEIKAANQAINKLQGEINDLRSQVNSVAQHTGTVIAPAQVPGVSTLTEQVRELQANQHAVIANQDVLNADLQQVQSELNANQAHLNQVAQGIVGVRAEVVGFQDLVSLVQKQQQIDADVNAQQDHAIALHTHALAVLAPLSVLAIPGAAAIANLRKLEDNICQCPQFGNVGNELGTAIGLYEFLTNG